MNDSQLRIVPNDPDTDSLLNLNVESNSESSVVKVLEWRRILPNKNYVVIDSTSMNYQCTVLDKNCTVEAKVSVIIFSNLVPDVRQYI